MAGTHLVNHLAALRATEMDIVVVASAAPRRQADSNRRPACLGYVHVRDDCLLSIVIQLLQLFVLKVAVPLGGGFRKPAL